MSAPVHDSFGCASAAVAALREKLPGHIDVATHGGTFSEAEIKSFALKAPAVRVAALGFDTPVLANSGQIDLPVHMTAAVLTVDTAQSQRDQAANAIATAVALVIANNRLGLENGWPCEDVKGMNEYSATVQNIGLALWQVTWTQRIRLGTDLFEAIGKLTAATVTGPDGTQKLGGQA